ncbi:hypothetical protein ACOJIV_01085 [Haloarcula sp. AONF1]
MSHARSILLAGLLVLSTVVTGIGPALAQTATDSGPITYEYTGGASTLVIDTSAMDSGTDFTVEYTTMEGPGSPTVLARETYNTANLDQDVLWFYNSGAYDTVNVTVSGYSGGEPKFSTRGWATSINLKKTVVGSTGGDSDVTCDTSERISQAVGGGYDQLDCTPQPGTTTVSVDSLSQRDAELAAYQSGLNDYAAFKSYNTTLNNYLEDTKTQARIIGKNAYIRALNNGSSKSAAKSQAKQEVVDYYAVKQANLVKSWNTRVQHLYYLDTQLQTSDGQRRVIQPSLVQATPSWYQYGEIRQFDNSTTQTLVNGSTMDTKVVGLYASKDGGQNTVPLKFGNNNRKIIGESGNNLNTNGVKLVSPDGDQQQVLHTSIYQNKMSAISSQSATVESDIDTLAENTYSAYQNGEINNSDLVDPYVLASQQSPGSDFQGWTAAQLTLLGTNSPENFDQIGSFNVTTESGTQYEGILFSQENPASGQFENGTTYNTSNIGGTQYVVTSDRIVELDGEFTIDSISTQDGQTVQNVTIQKTTYETTNVTELKQQYEDLARKRAEIEAREQNLRGSAGGGLLGGSSSSLVLVLVCVGALYAVSQRRTGGNN